MTTRDEYAALSERAARDIPDLWKRGCHACGGSGQGTDSRDACQHCEGVGFRWHFRDHVPSWTARQIVEANLADEPLRAAYVGPGPGPSVAGK